MHHVFLLCFSSTLDKHNDYIHLTNGVVSFKCSTGEWTSAHLQPIGDATKVKDLVSLSEDESGPLYKLILHLVIKYIFSKSAGDCLLYHSNGFRAITYLQYIELSPLWARKRTIAHTIMRNRSYVRELELVEKIVNFLPTVVPLAQNFYQFWLISHFLSPIEQPILLVFYQYWLISHFLSPVERLILLVSHQFF